MTTRGRGEAVLPPRRRVLGLSDTRCGAGVGRADITNLSCAKILRLLRVGREQQANVRV